MTVTLQGGRRVARVMVAADLDWRAPHVEAVPPAPVSGLTPLEQAVWTATLVDLRELGLLAFASSDTVADYARCKCRIAALDAETANDPPKPNDKDGDKRRKNRKAARSAAMRHLASLAVVLGLQVMPAPVLDEAGKMILADLLGEEEAERIKAANVAAYEQAAVLRSKKAGDKRMRLMRKLAEDHQQRTGKRGSAARSGMMRPTAELEGKHVIQVDVHAITDDRGAVIRTLAPKVMTQTPIDRYRQRGSIDERQHKAAEKLFGDWYTSGLEARMVANLMGVGGGGNDGAWAGGTPQEGQAIAREAYRQAMKAVGKRLSPVLLAVVCEQRFVSDWIFSTGRRAPKDSRDKVAEIEGLTVLKLGLDVLADHYDEIGDAHRAARAALKERFRENA